VSARAAVRAVLVALEARAAEQEQAWFKSQNAARKAAGPGPGAQKRALRYASHLASWSAHVEHTQRLRALLARLDSDPESFDPARGLPCLRCQTDTPCGRTVYDFAWAGCDDPAVWATTPDGPVLVEACVRLAGDPDEPEGRPTGDYVLPEGDLPDGAGVLLPEASYPLWGVAAEREWARLVKLAATTPTRSGRSM